jgi:hypothetical protein
LGIHKRRERFSRFTQRLEAEVHDFGLHVWQADNAADLGRESIDDGQRCRCRREYASPAGEPMQWIS